MEQDLKQLLLKDLSARLPYHVKVKIWLEDGTTEEGSLDLENYANVLLDAFYYTGIKTIKSYLRSMSSMTEKENEEFEESFISYSISQDRNCVYHASRGDLNLEIIDWLNAHHFDYRGLIDKGLALEAPEGMYDLKEK